MKPSYCISIETTSVRLGLSLVKNGVKPLPLSIFFKEAGQKQSEMLLPELEKILKKNRIRKKDIGLIAVDTGPGSFTGVRVGVASARAMAQVLNVPLIGVSALEAMAWAAQVETWPAVIITCIPALPGELYFASYVKEKSKLGVRIKEKLAPTWKKLDEFRSFLAKQKNSNTMVVAESWNDSLKALMPEYPRLHWELKPTGPHPVSIAEVALDKWANGTRTSYEEVVPVYLQPSWAERTKNGLRRS